MPEGREKRKEKRIKVKLPVRISYRGAQVTGVTENISRLGAYVETARNIPLGAEFNIVLELPESEGVLPAGTEIGCKASVFRSGLAEQEAQIKYYGLGVFFTDFLEPGGREKLSDFVDFLAAQEEAGVKEAFKNLKARRSSSEKAQAASWQADCSGCLAELRQISSRLEEMYRLAKSKQKAP